MYKPVPPRPKKTDIVRSRNGCKGCRERRTKCDERKPTCGTCARLGRDCESIKAEFKFRTVTVPASRTAAQVSHSDDTRSANKTALEVISDSYSKTRICTQHAPKGPMSPSLIINKSLQHSELKVFYLTYWEDHCLPALHPVFGSISQLIGKFPALEDATIALSSCNFSRMHAEQKMAVSLSLMGGFSPNLTHQTRSQMYYSSAIKQFISFCQYDCLQNSSAILMLLILFAYIESSMGNFEGFYCHVQGFSKFLEDKLRETTCNPFFRALLTAWLQTQFVVWWARTYFSSLDVQRQQPLIHLPRALQESYEFLHERRVTVLHIMCESHRLNVKDALKHWIFHDESTISEDDSDMVSTLLAEESQRLDAWLWNLPSLEQPIESDDLEITYQKGKNITPLYFHSHDAALNYSYYVVSRIMQCTGFLYQLKTRDTQHLGHECYQEEPWVWKLLRIAKGVDMQKSISKNSYTIGFSGLLLAALLRCQDLSLGVCIEDWLQMLENMHPTEEGSFPVYQSLSVVKAINRLRRMGCDVFGVSQPIDDGGGTPKFCAYNSQAIYSLLFHGKWRASGELFSTNVAIERDGCSSEI